MLLKINRYLKNIYDLFLKIVEICFISFSLHAAFKIIQKPFSVLVIIKSSIIPPSLFSKKNI